MEIPNGVLNETQMVVSDFLSETTGSCWNPPASDMQILFIYFI